MSAKKTYRSSRHYEIRLLVAGLMLICVGLYELPHIWTFRSDLVAITGTISSADTYVTSSLSRRARKTGKEKNQKSELIFFLTGDSRKFYLSENIGSDVRNEEYEKIIHGLRTAKQVTVWIRSGDADEPAPKIFQIDSENVTLLDFERVSTGKTPMVIFLLALGTGSILLVLRMRKRI